MISEISGWIWFLLGFVIGGIAGYWAFLAVDLADGIEKNQAQTGGD